MADDRYPSDWYEIATAAKDRARWECEGCGTPHCDPDEKGSILTTHHLDADKSNRDPMNLIALCQICHLRAEVWSRNGEVLSRSECTRRVAWLRKEDRAQADLFAATA